MQVDFNQAFDGDQTKINKALNRKFNQRLSYVSRNKDILMTFNNPIKTYF